MIDGTTLKSLTHEQVQDELETLMDQINEPAPIDTAGMLLVLWDDLGNLYFRGAIPTHIRSGDGLRKIADSLDAHLGEREPDSSLDQDELPKGDADA